MAEGRIFRPVIEAEKCRTCQLCLGRCPTEWDLHAGPKEDQMKALLYPVNILERPSDQSSRLPVCQQACPIHQDTRGYAALIAQGKRQEALDLVRKDNPLPAVCGYICHHPCEAACLSSRLNEAIPLRLLKRFIAEEDLKTESRLAPFKIIKKARILIVGSGPAGLTAAHDLASLGYPVTIFESLPVLGGMLRVGIPAFRLPREILDKEIERIRQRGVEMQTRKTFFCQDITKNLKRLGFRAAFLAMGAHQSRRLSIPGERLAGVWGGVEFLRKFNLGQKISLGARVIVLGGGNVALDCARAALRLGAKEVRILYRRSLNEMPAIPEEIAAARKEGIEFLFLSMPMGITKSKNNQLKMDCLKTILSEADAGGRRQPVPQPGSEFSLWANSIISAIGQEVSRNISGELEVRTNGTLKIHPQTGHTSVKGVFAGGDVVTGPGWAIEAIAAGKKGAAAIHEFLS
jgi:NADPH-dependent glutamate synthase beta subunit-like oxidoreductase